MNTKHFLIAIEACNNGQVQFTKQTLNSFSLGGKWYPLRAVINYALNQSGKAKQNTDGCRSQLKKISIYTKFESIYYKERKPVNLTYHQQITEAQDIYTLSKS